MSGQALLVRQKFHQTCERFPDSKWLKLGSRRGREAGEALSGRESGEALSGYESAQASKR